MGKGGVSADFRADGEKRAIHFQCVQHSIRYRGNVLRVYNILISTVLKVSYSFFDPRGSALFPRSSKKRGNFPGHYRACAWRLSSPSFRKSFHEKAKRWRRFIRVYISIRKRCLDCGSQVESRRPKLNIFHATNLERGNADEIVSVMSGVWCIGFRIDEATGDTPIRAFINQRRFWLFLFLFRFIQRLSYVSRGHC